MNTAKTFQLRLTKALHANGDPVYAGALIVDEAVGFDRAGVRFHSNFRIRRQIQARTHAVQQRLHRRPGKQAWRTAANKNGLYFTPLRPSDVGIQIV
ncbi:Uncharacterised protein [Salmonella enterica subsp. enterica serovar Bovismorbificans]|uniref:Uncharacterized protein n=1 Tax=Salmonella enterica subsp. enterica serovar Bovismorbificans TaxID=58097 RepID=A0A655E5B3_SALET|nr:Uncharacterised protein [Salmonella enterica subsp. enterica serovar Bovismorbificans]CNV04631.1 Uncharacterised protein [Salmonella enterica subsp. enterica serovar Bovismorbificans]CNV07860.1 Uncharacterised protein [Salmonella enterica subsp. enterica serovar Bovismorbificans]CPR46115.1 Uncharacterised protein [Salmonella enterica subsp. enterica serovar Bovismorbificans]